MCPYNINTEEGAMKIIENIDNAIDKALYWSYENPELIIEALIIKRKNITDYYSL